MVWYTIPLHLLDAERTRLQRNIVSDDHHLAPLGVLGCAHDNVPGQHADLVRAHHSELLRQRAVLLQQQLVRREQLSRHFPRISIYVVRFVGMRGGGRG